jgi:hypothetical protein
MPCPVAPGGVAFADLPGVRVWLAPPEMQVSIDIDHSFRPPRSGLVDEIWAKHVAGNPKLYNGPLLSVVGFDPFHGIVRCVPDEYRRLMAQPEIDCGITLLAVSVVLHCTTPEGLPGVVLGLRSPRTRIYGGCWELGPSGGFDVPPADVPVLDHEAVLEQCEEELRSELALPMSSPRLTAVTYEHAANCLDLIVEAEVELPPEGPKPANWEYLDVRAVALKDLPSFDAEHAERIIPPTRALFRFFSWV